MFDAVFISDLHLHPEKPEITQRFNHFVSWAKTHTHVVYILGDFWHVWAGDDTMDAFSKSIVDTLKGLVTSGVSVYFMPGNRDFLVGSDCLKMTGMTLLADETVVRVGDSDILLAHGDGYCVDDKSHQWFRKVTRHRWFARIFLLLPKKIRCYLVQGVRRVSRGNHVMLNTVVIPPTIVVNAMRSACVNTLIHGHIHQPGLIKHEPNFEQYVLSDWDDNPQLLCYDRSKGLCFIQL